MTKTDGDEQVRHHPNPRGASAQGPEALGSQICPREKPRVRKASAPAPHEDYILERFMDGHHNAPQIHKEIVEQGYTSAYQNA